MPVDQIAAMMHEIGGLRDKYGLVTRIASHAGDGNIHLNILKGNIPDDEWTDRIDKSQHDFILPYTGWAANCPANTALAPNAKS